MSNILKVNGLKKHCGSFNFPNVFIFVTISNKMIDKEGLKLIIIEKVGKS